jgi:beta-lactamase superfamily II metal-dependent hydrolase
MPPSKTVLSSGNLKSGPKLIVDFIDVGQGNAVLVSYPNGSYMLADCGSQATSLNGGAYKDAQKYITSVTGGASIGTVVMSHGDDDHCAFIPHIAEAQNPTYVHFGGSITDYSKDVRDWIKSMENTNGRSVIRYPPTGYTDVSPDADFGSDTYAGEAHVMVLSANHGFTPNDNSIVLMIRFGNQAVILPGDAEAFTEAQIIANVPKKLLAKCTVLMPGHHGAFTSTSTAWADAVAPLVSTVSASGSNMSYAHPDCSTNTLLIAKATAGATQHGVICSTGRGVPYTTQQITKGLFVTSTNGDIRYTTDGENYKVQVSSYGEVLAVAPPIPKCCGSLVRNSPFMRERTHLVPVRAEPPVPRAAVPADELAIAVEDASPYP